MQKYCAYTYIRLPFPKEKQFQTQPYMEKVSGLIKDLENRAIQKVLRKAFLPFNHEKHRC